MEERWDVAVVGAGLAGLAAAATVARTGASVIVLDGRSPGGRARTDDLEGFRLNRGAHALFRRGAGRAVLDRLGVTVRGAAPPTKGAQGRHGERTGAVGLSSAGLVRSPLLTARGKARFGWLLAGARRWRPERLADRSAAAWLDELGLVGIDREHFEMHVRLSSYVADLDSVSADVVATQVRLAALSGVEYLHGGWQTLVDGLVAIARAHGAELRAGASVEAVVPEGDRVRVESGDDTVLARRVVVAAGTPSACAALLPDVPARWAELGPPARVACLDLGFDHVPVTTMLLGMDRPLYLIRHAPPASLAPTGGAVVHVMRYLRPDEDPAPEVARAELEEHARVAGLAVEDAVQVRYLHRMTACGAVPTPGAGMAGRVDVGDTGLDGVLVAGDWVGPAGHLADAALASGEAAGERIARELDRLPVRQTMARAS